MPHLYRHPCLALGKHHAEEFANGSVKAKGYPLTQHADSRSHGSLFCSLSECISFHVMPYSLGCEPDVTHQRSWLGSTGGVW